MSFTPAMLDESTLPARKVKIFTLRGKLEDIIAAIIMADIGSEVYVEDIANEFRSSTVLETADKVWTYWKTSIPYQEDPPGKQVIQSPGELYRNRHVYLGGTGKGGDCKSFSLACGAIFKALGIPYKYRFISERKEDELHHVYLIVDDTIPVDCVYDEFNAEIEHEAEVDIYPQQYASALAGITPAITTATPAKPSLENINSLDASVSTGWKPLAVTALGLITLKLIF